MPIAAPRAKLTELVRAGLEPHGDPPRLIRGGIGSRGGDDRGGADDRALLGRLWGLSGYDVSTAQQEQRRARRAGFTVDLIEAVGSPRAETLRKQQHSPEVIVWRMPIIVLGRTMLFKEIFYLALQFSILWKRVSSIHREVSPVN